MDTYAAIGGKTLKAPKKLRLNGTWGELGGEDSISTGFVANIAQILLPSRPRLGYLSLSPTLGSLRLGGTKPAFRQCSGLPKCAEINVGCRSLQVVQALGDTRLTRDGVQVPGLLEESLREGVLYQGSHPPHSGRGLALDKLQANV